jgi:hypothetical protein
MARAIGRLKREPGQKVGLLSKTLRLIDYRETHNCGYSNPGVDRHNPALEEPGVRQNSIDQDVWPLIVRPHREVRGRGPRVRLRQRDEDQ